MVLDKDQRIALANAKFARSVGLRPEELLGRRVSDLPWVAAKTAELTEEFPWVRTGCIEVRPARDIDTVRQRVGATNATSPNVPDPSLR